MNILCVRTVFGRYVLLTILLCVASHGLYGQCDSLSQAFPVNSDGAVLMALDRHVAVGDSVRLDMVRHLDFTNRLVPYFEFDWQSDSSRFHMIVDEFAHNGRWLMLEHWCRKKCWNWSTTSGSDTAEITDAMLSAISRTRTFTVAAGDTVSVYRDWTLHDYVESSTGVLTARRWVSAYPVSVAFEVVDASTNMRVALLDSIRIGTSSPDRRPCVHAPLPNAARLVWVAPSMPATAVYLRVLVSSGGAPNPFFRCDDLDIAWSMGRLGQRAWVDYTDSMNVYNACPASLADCPLIVTGVSAPSGLSFSTPPGMSGLDAVRIAKTGWNDRRIGSPATSNQSVDDVTTTRTLSRHRRECRTCSLLPACVVGLKDVQFRRVRGGRCTRRNTGAGR